jgi:uncharacterized integral membrane protein
MGDQAEDEETASITNSEQEEVPPAIENQVGTVSESISSTRTSRVWIGVLPVIVVLIIILVFVFQNSKDVKVSLFTLSGTLPLSVALLGAVILGALMVLTLGSLRIFQLRRQFHRRSRRNQVDEVS